MSTISEKKNCMLPTFQNWTFCKDLYGVNDELSIWGNGARNIQLNYNQMRAYVEYSPDQSKNYTLSTFPLRNRRSFEDSGKVLAISVSEFYQSIAVQLYQPTRYHHWMCKNRQLFLKYVNRFPSVCVTKVASWHAFFSPLGMFSRRK